MKNNTASFKIVQRLKPMNDGRMLAMMTARAAVMSSCLSQWLIVNILSNDVLCNCIFLSLSFVPPLRATVLVLRRALLIVCPICDDCTIISPLNCCHLWSISPGSPLRLDLHNPSSCVILFTRLPARIKTGKTVVICELQRWDFKTLQNAGSVFYHCDPEASVNPPNTFID